MKHTLLKLTAILLIFCSCLTVVSCSGNNAPPEETKTIEIPDILGLDETTAKTLLAGKGLIPKVQYDWNSDYPEGQVAISNPAVGSVLEEDDVVTLTISKGPIYYALKDTVGYMKNIHNVDAFSWEDDTKGFYGAYRFEDDLCIEMYIKCVSIYSISFYGEFGSASLTDTFEKTVPIDVEYSNKTVNANGEKTAFTVSIPLLDLGEKKPTNVYVKLDFVVGGERETFEAGFDLSW